MLIIGCLSQKGGVAKSSLARLLATEIAAHGKQGLLADLDTLQATSWEWSRRRTAANLSPDVPVKRLGTLQEALKAGRKASADVLVLDARGVADSHTLEAALASHAVFIPTGLAVDDLLPAVRLAHELTRSGLSKERIAMVLCLCGDAPTEVSEARRYLAEAGYYCLSPIWPERAGYRRAHDEGRSATEARHRSLRIRAQAVADAALRFADQQPKSKEVVHVRRHRKS